MATPQQIATIKEVFALFDRDGDGFIPCKDIANVIRATGTNPSEKELDEMLAGKADAQFSYKDFEALVLPRITGKDVVAELTQAFKPFDRGNTGHISAAELRSVMASLGERLTKEEIDKMISEADPTNSGKISYDEFIRVLTN
eukprot:Blabericola_migrator_1__5468@NODE_2795_length_2342_cov_156_509890_g60_i1_p3_GENE_NODE_2795_length_2342_cov_156_509890_g60_i1NODE_2795_length_2342_cov_156_509890_g60_i1_p3_ORF_typecomplete_len143_score30_43EFhand_7/PF13499_6/3_4e09EFhand_7/PF13499_6/9_9e18EFhand_8/PF13833_6/0_0083EFhand_8/PF13833_6/1_3EFhand_8/PF13833_6/3_5e16EFhand_11/PF08976_11/0_03EFhand_11/PF08976_11/2_7e15EFhand_6/PF13405_6/4_7e06EFhand_6/PF13405_6/1_2e03EFhand_6/PF13405_6/6_9e05EFhand_6/PF13405_6/0_09EFhand_1/PF00036_32/4_8